MTLLAKLQRLVPVAAAATAGPWRVSPHPDGGPSRAVDMGRRRSPKAPFCVCHGDDAPQLENAAFIAAARNVLSPANLSELIGQLSALAEIKQLLNQAPRMADDARLFLISEALNGGPAAKQ